MTKLQGGNFAQQQVQAELLAASRLFLQEIEERITARESFAFETTRRAGPICG